MSIQLRSSESIVNEQCMFVLSLSTPAVTEPLTPLMSLTHELCRYLAEYKLETLHSHGSPSLLPDRSSWRILF